MPAFDKSLPHMVDLPLQVASAATMRAPEEVFQSAQHGQPRTAEELTREQRRAARAKRKRGGKKEKEGQVGASRGGCECCGPSSALLCAWSQKEWQARKQSVILILKKQKILILEKQEIQGVPWGVLHLLPMP